MINYESVIRSLVYGRLYFIRENEMALCKKLQITVWDLRSFTCHSKNKIMYKIRV